MVRITGGKYETIRTPRKVAQVEGEEPAIFQLFTNKNMMSQVLKLSFVSYFGILMK